jgi:hypothetical protein
MFLILLSVKTYAKGNIDNVVIIKVNDLSNSNFDIIYSEKTIQSQNFVLNNNFSKETLYFVMLKEDNNILKQYESAKEIILKNNKITFQSEVNDSLSKFEGKDYYKLINSKRIPSTKLIDLILGIFSIFLFLNFILPKIFYNKKIKFKM